MTYNMKNDIAKKSSLMSFIRRTMPLLAVLLTTSITLPPMAQAAQQSAMSTPAAIATKVNAYFARLTHAKQFSGAVLLVQGQHHPA